MIQTEDVRVDYDGLTAVADLSLSIGRGEVFGLIGPNGAGKTSTIRVLATLQEPTYGQVYIHGIDAAEAPRQIHRILGYMPDNAPVYEELTCVEFLRLFAGAYFVDRRDRERRIDETLDRVGLTEKRRAKGGTLSRGMKQRLLLGKTLLQDPQVLLLDEPASGLDPMARIDMRNLLVELGRLGKTILVSSHILAELAGFCTSVGIMEKGRMLVSGRIEQIVAGMRPAKRLVIELTSDDASYGQSLRGMEKVADVNVDHARIEIEFTGDDHDAAALLRRLIADGWPIKGFYERRLGVEDIMLQLDARQTT